MNFAEAAVYVLEQAGEPLHFRDITQRAVDQGLIEVEGQTPWNSMNGVLRRTIRRHPDEAPFVSLGEGLFGMRAWGLENVEDLSEDDRAPAVAGRIIISKRAWAQQRAGATLPSLATQLRGWSERGRVLVTRHPSYAPYAQLSMALRGLLVWGLSSLLSGLVLVLGQGSPFLRGLVAQFLAWGAANTGLAVAGLAQLGQSDTAVAAGQVNRKRVNVQIERYRRLLAIGATAGALATLTGFGLRHAGQSHSRSRGAAIGLLTQGSFWLLLGTLSRWLLRARGQGR